MNKKIIFFLVLAAFLIGSVVFYFKLKPGSVPIEAEKEIKPFIGSVREVISTTGTVLPENRLEIKPPVNGRVETMLAKEGEQVKQGQILAWMSSTERAALLDAARGQGEDALKYWQEVYKAIPLIAPIDAEVIVAKIQPGQTVTTADAVVVLSDHLIVRAQVDETDIGKIKTGQKAVIAIDAYPDTKIDSFVKHIYYESKTVNNVTIYEVDLLPEKVPQFFRSGMNASVDFIEKSKDNAVLLPLEAVHKEEDESFVYLKRGNEIQEQKIETGLFDDKNMEVISGLDTGDVVIIKTRKFILPKSDIGTNPFMPQRRRQNSRN